MKTYVACNTPSFAKTITAALEELHIECAPSRVLSIESIENALTAAPAEQLVVVFFASTNFAARDVETLKNLCVRGFPNVKVIAVGANFSPSAIMQVVHAGAVDCLDIARDFERELAELLARVRMISCNGSREGKLYTVIGATGGCGASVLAANLALLIARQQQQCALLDLHVRGGDLAPLLKAAPRYTLLSLAANSEQLDRAMFEQSLFAHESGIRLLASPEPLGDYRAIRPELIQRTVHLARGTFPSVVADLEDCEHPGQVQTLASSDGILLTMRPDILSLYRTKKCIEFLHRSNVPRERLYLVINRVGQPKEITLSQIKSTLGISIAARLPDDPATVNSSVNLGIPLVQSCPDTPISKCIADLANRLIGNTSPMRPPNWAQRQLCRIKSVAAVFQLVQA
jgi:pilus assembly protein CpaE